MTHVEVTIRSRRRKFYNATLYERLVKYLIKLRQVKLDTESLIAELYRKDFLKKHKKSS